MAQVKLLKIGTDGVPTEFSSTDDITLNSYAVSGGGPSLSATGLALAAQAISGSGNISFTSAATNGLTQTAGVLAADNIVAKDRSNTFTVAGELLFPTVTDTAGQIDNFKLPVVAGVPTATPTNAGSGFTVWDSTDARMYVWSGTAWIDQSTISYAPNVQNAYSAGAGGVAARDVTYISAADTVLPASAASGATAQAIGFAVTAAAAAASVQVQENGVMTGFAALTAGARYYLSGTTAGQITATIPVTAGHTIVQVGYAKSTTALAIRFENMGRRS